MCTREIAAGVGWACGVRVAAVFALSLAAALIFPPVIADVVPGARPEGNAAAMTPGCAVCLTAAEAASRATTSDDLYAAIAYSRSTGNSGYAFNFATRAGAEARALERCGASDCSIYVWVRNGCCALAVGDGNRYGWSWRYGANAYSEARSRAMAECNARTGNCRIVAWTCTDR